MNEQKLNDGQRHILNLVYRDRDSEGWANVSKTLMATLRKTTPPELAEFEEFENGRGRVRLTERGKNVVELQGYF